jgi:hypothetical protein
VSEETNDDPAPTGPETKVPGEAPTVQVEMEHLTRSDRGEADPSMAPTVVDAPPDSSRNEVEVPKSLRDSAALLGVGEEADPSGPSTLVEPSSSSSKVSDDFWEQARAMREEWDEDDVLRKGGTDAALAEELGASFDPAEPSSRPDPKPQRRRVRPEPMPELAEGEETPEEEGGDGEDGESLEEKKEQMRRYMAADREMDSWKNSRRRGGGGFGGLGCLMRTFLILAAVAGVGALIWAWHPWRTEAVVLDAREHPGICSPGVEGQKTIEYLTIFGVRVTKTGESTVCLE